ncbi:hypothetical protein DH2020_036363 [Rehmannia glutinosa]|uniref:Uncharacterized protein n=1 Tax=Rehmannia glutinosa TaxID=99300 RepID=A0ABR0V522_REHGL
MYLPRLETLPLHPSVDPKYVLSGNFAPVDELPPTACAVVDGDALPPCLNGVYIRKRPLAFWPIVPNKDT